MSLSWVQIGDDILSIDTTEIMRSLTQIEHLYKWGSLTSCTISDFTPTGMGSIDNNGFAYLMGTEISSENEGLFKIPYDCSSLTRIVSLGTEDGELGSYLGATKEIVADSNNIWVRIRTAFADQIRIKKFSTTGTHLGTSYEEQSSNVTGIKMAPTSSGNLGVSWYILVPLVDNIAGFYILDSDMDVIYETNIDNLSGTTTLTSVYSEDEFLLQEVSSIVGSQTAGRWRQRRDDEGTILETIPQLGSELPGVFGLDPGRYQTLYVIGHMLDDTYGLGLGNANRIHHKKGGRVGSLNTSASSGDFLGIDESTRVARIDGSTLKFEQITRVAHPLSVWKRYPLTESTIGAVELNDEDDGGFNNPSNTALTGYVVNAQEVQDMRDAVEAIFPKLKNPVTGNAYNDTLDSADNIFYLSFPQYSTPYTYAWRAVDPEATFDVLAMRYQDLWWIVVELNRNSVVPV